MPTISKEIVPVFASEQEAYFIRCLGVLVLNLAADRCGQLGEQAVPDVASCGCKHAAVVMPKQGQHPNMARKRPTLRSSASSYGLLWRLQPA